MNQTDAFAVTLTPELFERLSAESVRLGVPLEWVVASMVLDTVEARPMASRAA